jgi:Helix-turn-helix domain
MSWQAAAWATKQRVGDSTLKLLLLILANYANEEGECWHSQKRISFDSEIPERTLRRKMTALVELGLIEITERRRDDGMKATSLIRLISEPAATVAGGEDQRPKSGVTSGQNGGVPAATKVAGPDSSKNNLEPSMFTCAKASLTPADDWPADAADQFWLAFPPFRRQARAKVAAKLARIRKEKVTWATVFGGLLKFSATNPGEFAPAPMVWLNEGRWDREYGTGGFNGATQSTGGSKGGGFSSLAARLRSRMADADQQRPAPEDIEPINRH